MSSEISSEERIAALVGAYTAKLTDEIAELKRQIYDTAVATVVEREGWERGVTDANKISQRYAAENDAALARVGVLERERDEARRMVTVAFDVDAYERNVLISEAAQEWAHALDAMRDTSVLASIPKKMARIKKCEDRLRAALSSPPPHDGECRVHDASCASRNRDPCDCGGVAP